MELVGALGVEASMLRVGALVNLMTTIVAHQVVEGVIIVFNYSMQPL